jgi:RNA polymerase sigma factor (sigma-70 family)
MSLRDFDLHALLSGQAASEALFLAALKDLVFRIARNQYRFAPADAEDLLGQIVEKLWRNDREALRRWRNDSPLETYLAVVTNRFCLMRLRAAKRAPSTSGLETLESLPAGASSQAGAVAERWESCKSALAALPERDRSLIEMRYLSGLEYDEIVARLGISHGAARKALHTALERLRVELRRRAPDLFGR